MSAIGKMIGGKRNFGVGNFMTDATMAFAGYSLIGGNDPATAMVKGLGEAVMWNAVGPVGNIFFLGQLGVMGVSTMYNLAESKWDRVPARNYGQKQIGGGYRDTRQALTQRQAAVQAIQQSRINGRQVLGNEASFLHR